MLCTRRAQVPATEAQFVRRTGEHRVMVTIHWPIWLAAGSWLLGLFLILRVSAFRKDRLGTHGALFGFPYALNLRYLQPDNFTRDGRVWLYALWLDTLVFAVAAVVAMARFG